MPKAYGGDQLISASREQIEIHSALDKGWRPNMPRTHTSAEYPGTPVHWDDHWYEVITVETTRSGARLYTLKPWRDKFPIRNPSEYSEATAKALKAQHAQTLRREKASRSLLLSGLVIGHAPAHAQLEIEREYGLSATTLSLVSMLGPFLFAVWAASHMHIPGITSGTTDASRWQALLGGYWGLESAIRVRLVLARGTPIGSVLGLIGYEIWQLVSSRGKAFDRRASVKAETKLSKDFSLDPSAAVVQQDAYEMRAPLLSFLSPAEQLRMAEWYGFDPIKRGRATAITIAVFTALGVVTSIRVLNTNLGDVAAWCSLVMAGYLLVEQLVRLNTFSSGKPAGSVLGVLARPLCRKLLAIKPTALEEGTLEAAPVSLPNVWEGEEPGE